MWDNSSPCPRRFLSPTAMRDTRRDGPATLPADTVSELKEVRVPIYPDCWETCGNCAQGEVSVWEILVKPGDVVEFDDNVVTLETGKVALDIQTPHAGRVAEIFVAEGQEVAEGALLLTIDATA